MVLIGLMVNNTYFASATWYDDDDSKPVFRKHSQPLRGRKIPSGDHNYIDSETVAKYVSTYSPEDRKKLDTKPIFREKQYTWGYEEGKGYFGDGADPV